MSNPSYLAIRVYLKSGLVKDLFLEPTDDSNPTDSWKYLSQNMLKMDTLYVSENSMTRGWWVRTSEIIFIERIG